MVVAAAASAGGNSAGVFDAATLAQVAADIPKLNTSEYEGLMFDVEEVSGSAADKVESARRVLDDEGEWIRSTTERLTTPARRSRVGLNAPPLPLAAALVRHSHSQGVQAFGFR